MMQYTCRHPLNALCAVQITMKFNHNGTHIEGMGFKHGEHRVIVNVNAHDSLEGKLPCLRHGRLTPSRLSS